MRKQHRLSLAVPIPANVPPVAVVNAIRSIEPFVRLVGFMSSFKELPSSPEPFANDPWFVAPYEEVFSYDLQQTITLMPGLTRQAGCLIYLQRIGDTVRGRANNQSANIIVWTEFSVRLKQNPASPASATTTSSSMTMTDGEEYELVEEAVIEANSLMMPFVTPVTIVAHKDLLKKLLEEATKNYFNGVQY
ncbi:Fc.00g069810.m01.CDS01 [Cosmosporella sp. VM-42]